MNTEPAQKNEHDNSIALLNASISKWVEENLMKWNRMKMDNNK